MKTLTRFLLIAATLLPLVAKAETYRVDVIVFVDKSAPGEQGRRPALPDMRRAIELSDSAGLSKANITLLPAEQTSLASEWQKLSNSKRYQPVSRLSWIQKDPPENNAPVLHVRVGEPNGDIAPIDGTLGLSAGHYLHLDVDMLYTQATGDGTRMSYRLRENRKMMRDELHHLDSPKLGILARITKSGG